MKYAECLLFYAKVACFYLLLFGSIIFVYCLILYFFNNYFDKN
ncbi:MAG TPA: hypothetical protein OIL79_04490 [Coprobacillaceae bacterium]|nr:hypothetical protein [Coprobacillaceae bacterium]